MLLHLMGRAYGLRPSAFVGGLTEVQAFTIDHAAFSEGSDAERAAMKHGKP